MRVQASINIDLDTLAEDVDDETRTIQSDALRAITYRRVLPRFLELLHRYAVPATFFVIGRDIDGNEETIRSIANDGHELANHTMTHPKQLVRLSDAAMTSEIEECGRRLARIAGRPTVGFRAPGYTISPRVTATLRRMGYSYDASLNPSLVYSMAKRGFKSFRLRDREYVSCQPWRDHFGPRNPYRMATDTVCRCDVSDTFIEIPVSVIPFVQYPFVTSLLLPHGIGPTLWGLDRLVASRRFVNCGIHVNEFTDAADLNGVPQGFYYTRRLMRPSLDARLRYFATLLDTIKRRCDVVLLRDVRP